MNRHEQYEVLIVGGSYAGLSAAMTLGRSLRKVLVLDSGHPCNRQTPHAHNFITQDGVKPAEIARKAKSQVLSYDTVTCMDATVIKAERMNDQFIVHTTEDSFTGKKLLFATGVKDLIPAIGGFSECWGISVLHCPYCHGYEVRGRTIGLIANGQTAFDLCILIQHWTDDLTLYTNGSAELSSEQIQHIQKLGIGIVDTQIARLIHRDGYVSEILFRDRSARPVEAIFSRVPFQQHCSVPVELGCDLTEQGHIDVDFFQKTSIEGVFCAGDCTTPFRALTHAAASGNKAGVFINMELIQEEVY
ncbi:MAG: NAD(P)/FAD-dependent oxidoreductase [Bacteroidota bacterium]